MDVPGPKVELVMPVHVVLKVPKVSKVLKVRKVVLDPKETGVQLDFLDPLDIKAALAVRVLQDHLEPLVYVERGVVMDKAVFPVQSDPKELKVNLANLVYKVILALLENLALQVDQGVKVQLVHQELKVIQVLQGRSDVLDQPDPRVIKVFQDYGGMLEKREQGVEMVQLVPRVCKVQGDLQVHLGKMVLMEDLVVRELLEIPVKWGHLV